jgi:hypothetical protein
MGKSLYGAIHLEPGQEKDTGTTQEALHLGTTGINAFGDVYRYSKAGAVALTAGKVMGTALNVANHDLNLATAAAAIGAKAIVVTLGSTAATEDQYKDGLVYVNDVTGEGHAYRIAQHDAVDSAGALTANLYDGDAVKVALDATSQCGLIQNPYNGILINAATVVQAAVGVTVGAIAAASFGWVQVEGLAPVLADGTIVIANHVRCSDGTAGAVEALDRDVGGENDIAIGVSTHVIAATTEYGMIRLGIG